MLPKDKARILAYKEGMRELGLNLIPVVPDRAWVLCKLDYQSGQTIEIAQIYYDSQKPFNERFCIEKPK